MPLPKRLVIWGGRTDGNSLHHIFRHFHTTAHKLGIKSIWTDDQADARSLLEPGVTVIGADLWGEHIGPAVEGVDYVLHNYTGDHILCQTVEPEHILRLQVYTSDASGEELAPYRLYDRNGRVLYQPWGTNLLAEEFPDPIFNPHSRDATFVGSVWRDIVNGVDLGNMTVIEELRLSLADHVLKFKQFSGISDQVNEYEVRAARLAPAFSGQWQVDHDLLPCRVFKNASYGALAVSNVPAFQRLFGGSIPKIGSVSDMIEKTLSLKKREYVDMVREQQRVVANYSYRDSLTAIGWALEEGRG